jgi:hypothetical protein
MKSNASWPKLNAPPASAWPRCVIARQLRLQPGEIVEAESFEHTLCPRGQGGEDAREVAGEIELSGAHAMDHAGQFLHQRNGDEGERQDDDDENDRERRQRSEVLAAAHPREQPAMERLEQQRQHAAPEHGAVERPDDPRERERQDDQQDQECVAIERGAGRSRVRSFHGRPSALGDVAGERIVSLPCRAPA